MRILIVHDGRPGHFHLAEGIADAVGRLCAVEVSWLLVRPRYSGNFVARLTRLPLPPGLFLKGMYGLDRRKVPTAELIVSAGGNTLAANVWIARHLGAMNMFYGSLRRYRPGDFTLVLTSYRRSEKRPNIVRTLKPSPVDPDTLPAIPGRRVPKTLGLVVGGPTAEVPFQRADWSRLCWMVTASHAELGIRWVISNSPRTPAQVTDRLRRLAAEPGGAVAEWIDIGVQDAPRLSHLFAQVEGVVCTADSSSMVSESVWARRSVISAEPLNCMYSTDEVEYRSWLEQNRWCVTVPVASLTPRVLLEKLRVVKPMRHNPLDALAELLGDRLPVSRIWSARLESMGVHDAEPHRP